MKVCLWNIDCPEFGTKKFNLISNFLMQGEFDLIISLEVGCSLR